MTSHRLATLGLDSSPTRRPGFFLIFDWLGVPRRCSGWKCLVKSGFLSSSAFESPTRDTTLRSRHLRDPSDVDLGLFLGWPSRLLVPNDDDLEQRSRSVFLIVLFTLQLQSLLPVLIHCAESAMFYKLPLLYLLSALLSGSEEPA